MKRITGFFAVLFTALIIQSFVPANNLAANSNAAKTSEASKKTDYVKYVFCFGWEQAKSGGKNQPVVTNVFKFTCGEENFPKDYIILGQFTTYYDAFYKKNRNTMYIKDDNKMMYDSYSEAEKGRREQVAKYVNNGNDPLLMDKFSILCDK